MSRKSLNVFTCLKTGTCSLTQPLCIFASLIQDSSPGLGPGDMHPTRQSRRTPPIRVLDPALRDVEP